jgi:phage repressor protein C with HTH and peptisase S24 domain
MAQPIVPASKIHQRIEETMRLRGLKARRWSLLATDDKPDTVRNILREKSREPRIGTLEKLALAANVSLDWLRGIAESPEPPRAEPRLAPSVALIGYVGAGEQIYPIDLAEAQENERVPAPPGLIEGVAAKVRGHSMHPVYRDGDLVFAAIHDGEIDDLVSQDCFVQITGGAFYLKHLRRSARRGTWDLLSYNPEVAPIRAQKVKNAAPVRWVHRSAGPRRKER